MTTNQGSGVPVELRERLARRAFRRWVGPSRSFDAADPSVRAALEREADAILSEIAASGHVIVAGDRMERLQEAAYAAKEFTDTVFLVSGLSNEQAAMIARDLGVLVAEAVLRLQPGDLDAGESEVGR